MIATMAGDPFSPITFGARLRSVEAGAVILTETAHPPALRLPAHRHELPNLVFVLEGSFLETMQGQSHECKPGSMLLKPGGAIHEDRYGNNGARCLIVEIKAELMSLAKSLPSLFDRIEHFCSGFHSLIGGRIYNELKILDSASTVAIEGLVLELLSQSLRVKQERLRNTRQKPAWLNQAKELIEERYYTDLSLARIASIVGVHPAHLARKFRRQYGLTVGECIRKLRIQQAIHELTFSDKPVMQIALDAGFYDQSHFSHNFKKHTGQTPAELRRIHHRGRRDQDSVSSS